MNDEEDEDEAQKQAQKQSKQARAPSRKKAFGETYCVEIDFDLFMK